MTPPSTVGALMQLVHDGNWMLTAIPTLLNLIYPLQDLLEASYTKQNTWKKTRLVNCPISAWGDEH